MFTFRIEIPLYFFLNFMSFVITRLEAFSFQPSSLISREELKKIDAWLTFGSFQTSSRLLRLLLDDLFFVWNREILELK